MIEPKELRIGNWVKYGNDPSLKEDLINKWVKVTVDVIKWASNPSENCYEPIPLTPKILEMCPQLKKWENYNTYELELPNGTIQVTGNEVWLGGNDSCTSGMGFTLNTEYLHQFQNLIHDLTHKELEIKELQHA